ncbi:MAG: 2-5 ligase [Fibrobacteres bacterium]|nr:2-5 ligase [Fibrobacterota bacterium]
MPRIFVALDMPEHARERLNGISSGLPGADWVSPDQYHLTLRFIGEVDKESLDVIREGLGGVVARSFYLSLKGIGVFPLRGDPEILWAGVARNEGLRSLRNKVESLLGRKGIAPDTRKFFPHVTLAKVKGSKSEWVGEYVAGNSLFSLSEIPVQGFSLYSSRLTPEGSIYTLEGSYPLDGILEAD